MNKTKKRAAKRAATKSQQITHAYENDVDHFKRMWITNPTFKWVFPLDSLHKIANLKCYREFHRCTLGEAKTAVEAAMEAQAALF
jgi:ribosomal protein L7/L12